ncbi:MAG: O-methyltransferase [Pyrinomonadaceae bacterium]|jgi:hypothetical protein|nr:O-methyltransferase [Pyrinomonadaceae bacterium]
MDNPVKLVYRTLLKPIYARLNKLEYHILEPHNRRWVAIDDLTDYLTGADVPGDYLEFGVYIGTTFIHAYHRMSWFFKEMRFFALDSFEGLPKPRGLDALNGYTSKFFESQFSCSEDQFIDHLKAGGVDLNKVTTVPGWFDKSLTDENAAAHGIGKIAAAWIDCDLYESTVPILKFITSRLSTGSVVLFDDWKCFRNSPDLGEQRACREWLAENPQITLRELFSFGSHGIAFTVHISESVVANEIGARIIEGATELSSVSAQV